MRFTSALKIEQAFFNLVWTLACLPYEPSGTLAPPGVKSGMNQNFCGTSRTPCDIFFDETSLDLYKNRNFDFHICV